MYEKEKKHLISEIYLMKQCRFYAKGYQEFSPWGKERSISCASSTIHLVVAGGKKKKPNDFAHVAWFTKALMWL